MAFPERFLIGLVSIRGSDVYRGRIFFGTMPPVFIFPRHPPAVILFSRIALSGSNARLSYRLPSSS
jgi:hypothetical protein